ncbi:MAG: MFS transporter [Hyphomonas sp.]
MLTITIFDLALIIATQMLMGSMVADIVEDSEVQTGRRSEGIFYAGISFIRKLSQAGGVFVATSVLTMAGIQEGARPDQVTSDLLTALGWGYAVTSLLTVWMPAILCVALPDQSREPRKQPRGLGCAGACGAKLRFPYCNVMYRRTATALACRNRAIDMTCTLFALSGHVSGVPGCGGASGGGTVDPGDQPAGGERATCCRSRRRKSI